MKSTTHYLIQYRRSEQFKSSRKMIPATRKWRRFTNSTSSRFQSWRKICTTDSRGQTWERPGSSLVLKRNSIKLKRGELRKKSWRTRYSRRSTSSSRCRRRSTNSEFQMCSWICRRNYFGRRSTSKSLPSSWRPGSKKQRSRSPRES